MERKLKVNVTSGYKYKDTPTIQLKGSYLEQFGFSIDTHLKIFLANNQIIITPDKAGKEAEE